MKDFRAGFVAEWKRIEPGELVVFPIFDAGYRVVRCKVLAGEWTQIFVLSEHAGSPLETLVAAGDGLMELEFTVSSDASLHVIAHKDAPVFFWAPLATQVIAESEEGSFTVIEPRERQPNAEIQRLFTLMQRQNALREEQIRLQYEERMRREGGIIETPPNAGPRDPAAQVAGSGDGGAS